MNLFRPLLALLASASLMLPAGAQSPLTPPVPVPPTPVAPAPAPAPVQVEKPFVPQLEVDETTYVKKTMDELEQLVARVALYPDELLAQILPSATSPLDVVKAHQFLREHPDLKEPPADAVKNWDPAVVSLMQFPDVIKKMAGDITWTTSLGEAVFFQEEDVYDAIQLVRSKAHSKGMLVDNDKQIHIREDEIMRIEPSDPQVIYVPQYDPQVIYVEQPVVYYEPLITYSRPYYLGWGMCWAFDWYNRCCVPHHHWYYTWHHRNYNNYYGRNYYGGHYGRYGSVCPPGGRPPRPPGWRPHDQRPVGWKPPRPNRTLAGRAGSKPGSRPTAAETVWKPKRPVGARDSGRRPNARETALVGGERSLTGRSAASRPGTSTAARPESRPGSRPGTLRSTNPGAASTGSTPLAARTGSNPTRSATSSTRPGAPATGSIRPSTPSSRPGSSPGSLRNTQAGPATAEARIPSSRPGTRPTRPSSPSTAATTPTPRPSRTSSAPARPGSRIASSGTPSRSSSTRPSSSGIRMIPQDSTYQRNLRPVRPSSSSRVSPSRSTSRTSTIPSRSSSTRVSPTPSSRSTYRPSPAPSRSSVSRPSPTPSRSTSRPSPTPSRSSSRPAPSRSSSRPSSSRPSSSSRGSSSRRR